MAAAVLERVLQPQSWPASAWVLLLASLATFVYQFLMRPPIPENAPKFWATDDLPFLGALRFHRARYDYLMQALGTVKGNFSFYVGKKHVVALRGVAGRQLHFESRELNFTEGFAELLAGLPPSAPSDFSSFFTKTLITMMKKENFVRNLHLLTGDARSTCEELAMAAPSKAAPAWRVTNPFDSVYQLVYQLTMRTVGASEIANDLKLRNHTLAVFEEFDRNNSVFKTIFPWLPTLKHWMRMYNGARLYMVFQKIVQDRAKEGRKEVDAVQFLLDQGVSVRDLVSFEVGVLFAGLVNSGIHAAWVPTYLCMYPEWREKVRDEVDGVVAKHRTSPAQSPLDILGMLTVEDWESEFPLIDLCLRESIRIGSPGSSFRKNTSGADLPIGKSGEVIPKGAFSLYMLDEVHLNSAVYTDPLVFDPGRFLPERAEDKKQPLAFLGWGTGRHPCLGMKFAKLEMSLINAYLVAMFDFELSDRDGNQTSEHPPPIDHNQIQSQKPARPIFLRYKPRVY